MKKSLIIVDIIGFIGATTLLFFVCSKFGNIEKFSEWMQALVLTVWTLIGSIYFIKELKKDIKGE